MKFVSNFAYGRLVDASCSCPTSHPDSFLSITVDQIHAETVGLQLPLEGTRTLSTHFYN